MTSLQTEELLRKLDEQHQAYIQTFKLLHEALAQNAQNAQNTEVENPPSSTNNDGLTIPIPTSIPIPSPAPAHLTLSPPLSPPSRTPSRRRRRSTSNDLHERPFRRTGTGTGISTFHGSVFTGDSDDSDLDGDNSDLYVQAALPSYAFDLEDLRQHLKTYLFTEAGEILLNSVVWNGRLKHPALFREYPKEEKWHNSHYSVFDVDRDGKPVSRREVVRPGTMGIDEAVWQVVQDLNVSPEVRTASGRITIIREPSPLILGALHLTMNRDFDMDEIFAHLVDEEGTNAQMTNRAFKEDERQQRSFIFNFDYYTVVGEEAQPMPWQRTDKPSTQQRKKNFEGHIHLSRCTSVVALSLSGGYVKKLRNAARRSDSMRYGFVYDTWAPWQVLNIQCYPDHKHSMDSHDSTKHYVNGPEAFLHTLLAELKDAEKRFREINVRITRLVTPEPDFIFSAPHRDALLFEDHHFTYSRRYFWAYQTLGIMINSIKSILSSYHHTFTPEFWNGTHRSLFPLFDEDPISTTRVQDSTQARDATQAKESTRARNLYWRKRMWTLKGEFERQIAALEQCCEESDERRKEVRTLRDQLFSGTSVLESRKSVELSEVTILQGHNIKLLTLVSIFFLPLTFVTSVFGMSNMPQEQEFGAFGIVMSTVCIPFFLLIGSLNTTQGMKFWRGKYVSVLEWVFDRNSRGRKKTRDVSEPEEDGDEWNAPMRLKTHQRSRSTNIAMKKREEQIRPLQSPPPVALSSGSDERGKKMSPLAPATLSTRQARPGSELTVVEVLPDISYENGNDSGTLDRRRPGFPPRKEVMQMQIRKTRGASTISAREKDVEGDDGPSWWERMIGKRKGKHSKEGSV